MADYDEFAEEYARGTEDLERQTRLRFYATLPALEGKTLLDVACGSGHDGEYYASKGAIVHGVDISEVEIEMARNRGCGTFNVGSMDDLSYYDANTFDIVTSFYAIHNSENVSKALAEMIRVAKPGAAIQVLAKHPFRNLLEGHVNDGVSDYYLKRKVTSYIFNKSIKLIEHGHTMMDYLDPAILNSARLELLDEKTDFPVSDQVIAELHYPTYMVLKFQKLL